MIAGESEYCKPSEKELAGIFDFPRTFVGMGTLATLHDRKHLMSFSARHTFHLSGRTSISAATDTLVVYV